MRSPILNAFAMLALLLSACAPSPEALQSTVEAAVVLTQAGQPTLPAPVAEVSDPTATVVATPFPTATSRIASGAGAPRAGAEPTHTALPAATTVATSPPAVAVLRDHGTIQGDGSAPLVLAANEVAIGTADRYQDNLGENNPAFTVFAIYGPVNGSLSLHWGGWDRWADASDDFVAAQLQDKVAEVIRTHPDDYATRRIRVIECRGDVLACVVLSTAP